MKFLKAFLAAFTAGGLLYYGAVLAMIDAPISAEYWLSELITVKRELVKKFHGQRKIVLAGGSSTLFGVDAMAVSKELGMPVINLGLHAAMDQERILRITESVLEEGDVVILILEPNYFEPGPRFSDWQVRNTIAWDREGWREMAWHEKAQMLFFISPSMVAEMVKAQLQRRFAPSQISHRLATLDRDRALSKLSRRPMTPFGFEYSAYHLDDFGDMLKNEGSRFSGENVFPGGPNQVPVRCARSLLEFTQRMRNKQVQVFFANSPLMISKGQTVDLLRQREATFLRDFHPIGQFIDRREEVLFPRNLFFDTCFHLNMEGRALRTQLLVNSIRESVLPLFAGRKSESIKPLSDRRR